MRCKYKKSDKKQCKANAIRDDIFCFSHNPEYKEQKKLATSKGGSNRKDLNIYGDELQIETPDDIKNLMSKVINEVWVGRMYASNPAGALGYLSKIFLDAYDKCQLEERIENLEKKLEKIK